MFITINEKQKPCQIVDFVGPADHWKKESEKLEKYVEFAKKLKRLRFMKVRVNLIIIGDFGTIPKDLEKKLVELEIRGRIETIQNTE